MYQKIIILGNLGQDPEMRYMPDGTAVTNFSVATNRRWTDPATEETVSETTWFRCSAWGKRGEVINEWFTKGKPILIEGRLKVDPQTGGPKMFTRGDGTIGTGFEVNVDNFSFAGGGDERDGGSAPRSGTAAAQEEDEIPF